MTMLPEYLSEKESGVKKFIMVLCTSLLLGCPPTLEEGDSGRNKKRDRYLVQLFFQGILGFVIDEDADGNEIVWVFIADSQNPLPVYEHVPIHYAKLTVPECVIHPDSPRQSDHTEPIVSIPLRQVELSLDAQAIEEESLIQIRRRGTNSERPCCPFSEDPCTDCPEERYKRERQDLIWVTPISKIIEGSFDRNYLRPLNALTLDQKKIIAIRLKLTKGVLKTHRLEQGKQNKSIDELYRFILNQDEDQVMAKQVVLEFHATKPLPIYFTSLDGEPLPSLLVEGSEHHPVVLSLTNLPCVDIIPKPKIRHFKLHYNFLCPVPTEQVANEYLPQRFELTADEVCPPGFYD